MLTYWLTWFSLMAMYMLYKVTEDIYEIHSSFHGEQAMQGALIAVLVYATHTLGFKTEELQRALLDMLDKDNDAANFGINRTFIFSFNKKRKAG